MNVTVDPTYILYVLEENLSGTTAPGLLKNIFDFELRSYGNSPLQGVEFNISGFDGAFNFTYSPSSISSLVPTFPRRKSIHPYLLHILPPPIQKSLPQRGVLCLPACRLSIPDTD